MKSIAPHWAVYWHTQAVIIVSLPWVFSLIRPMEHLYQNGRDWIAVSRIKVCISQTDQR
jgi:hypothetical protein